MRKSPFMISSVKTYSCISTRFVSSSNLVADTAGFTARSIGLLYISFNFMAIRLLIKWHDTYYCRQEFRTNGMNYDPDVRDKRL